MLADYSAVDASWYVISFFKISKILSGSIGYDDHFVCKVINEVIRIFCHRTPIGVAEPSHFWSGMLGIAFVFFSKSCRRHIKASLVRKYGNSLLIWFEAVRIDDDNRENEAPAHPLSGSSFFQVARRYRYEK